MRQIPLRQRGKVVAFALVDDDDFEMLMPWRWMLNDRGYAQRSTTIGSTADGSRRRVNVRMHRQIMRLDHGDGLEVDHINRNPLDNRRSNLRVVNHSENHENRAGGYGSSRYRGVSWDTAREKWTATACRRIDGRLKSIHIGRFSSEEEAADAAAAWRREHMPYATN